MSPDILFEGLSIYSSIAKAMIDRLGKVTKINWAASIRDIEENDKQDKLFMRDMVAADLIDRVYSDWNTYLEHQCLLNLWI
ncbi:hypothetical protein PTI98_012548 [Pleurotus ostreatus]|nr:hypothetical protein PTI98_012548 [Pleurotus ostreatus]